jgi:hypothetical protein
VLNVIATTKYHSQESLNLNMLEMSESKWLRDFMDLREVTNRKLKKIAFKSSYHIAMVTVSRKVICVEIVVSMQTCELETDFNPLTPNDL